MQCLETFNKNRQKKEVRAQRFETQENVQVNSNKKQGTVEINKNIPKKKIYPERINKKRT